MNNKEKLTALLDRQHGGEQLSLQELDNIDFLIGFLGPTVVSEIVKVYSSDGNKSENLILSLKERFRIEEFSNKLVERSGEILSNKFAKEFINLLPDLVFLFNAMYLSNDPSMNVAFKDALTNALYLLDGEGAQLSLVILLANDKVRDTIKNLINYGVKHFGDENGNGIPDIVDKLFNKLIELLSENGDLQTQ